MDSNGLCSSIPHRDKIERKVQKAESSVRWIALILKAAISIISRELKELKESREFSRDATLFSKDENNRDFISTLEPLMKRQVPLFSRHSTSKSAYVS